jgi:hypothetical protein
MRCVSSAGGGTGSVSARMRAALADMARRLAAGEIVVKAIIAPAR